MIDPLVGAQPYQGRELAFKLGLRATRSSSSSRFSGSGADVCRSDLALIEINPLVITEQGNLHCLDAKVGVDSNALFRQDALRQCTIPARRIRGRPTPRSGSSTTSPSTAISAAWSTAPALRWAPWTSSLHGGFPANFLDVGGGATKERVTEAFKIILSDQNVKAVLINIFGGIVRCDLIAEGVIGAVRRWALRARGSASRG